MGVEKKSMEKSGCKNFSEKSLIFRKKSEKIRNFVDFLASAHHAPGSVSGGENVADLSAIN